jgi:hypothetical protein
MVQNYSARTRALLIERCDGRTPPGFNRFFRNLRQGSADPRFGDSQLNKVLAAWLRWGTAVGEPGSARQTISELRSCRRKVLPGFDASYQTWWRWTSTGKAWWVDITFDNRTGRALGGGAFGKAKVTGRLQDPFGWEGTASPGPGEDADLRWGASSFDSFSAPPGTTVWRVAPDADHDVHTTADGEVQVTEMTVYVRPSNGGFDCATPVRPSP